MNGTTMMQVEDGLQQTGARTQTSYDSDTIKNHKTKNQSLLIASNSE
jgi:hypothetical protein